MEAPTPAALFAPGDDVIIVGPLGSRRQARILEEKGDCPEDGAPTYRCEVYSAGKAYELHLCQSVILPANVQ